MVGPEALSSRDNQSLGKVPPHSLEAEEALLGSALLSRDAVTTVSYTHLTLPTKRIV